MEGRVSAEYSGDMGGVRMAVASEGIMDWIQSEDEGCRIEAAKEIRQLTKTSSKHRRQLEGAIVPLVSMLRSINHDSAEAAMLALLNLAVQDERCELRTPALIKKAHFRLNTSKIPFFFFLPYNRVYLEVY